MEKVNNISEAQNWFLSNSSGTVLCVNSMGEEREASYYLEAEEFLKESK